MANYKIQKSPAPRIASIDVRETGKQRHHIIGLLEFDNGWLSVHPICFGIGSIIKKPAVADDKIVIRDILKVFVLIDHDVMEGTPMARFINELKINIENGLNSAIKKIKTSNILKINSMHNFLDDILLCF